MTYALVSRRAADRLSDRQRANSLLSKYGRFEQVVEINSCRVAPITVIATLLKPDTLRTYRLVRDPTGGHSGFEIGAIMNFQSDRDFLEFHSLPADLLTNLIERAGQLAAYWESRAMPQTLKGKRVGIIVDDTGWRNTTAFDLGVQAMGGVAVQPPIRFNVGEATADLAGYLDNWFDLLVV